MCEIRNQKYSFSFFECKAGRLSKYGKDDLYLSFLIEPKNISVFSHTVHLFLDDDRAAEFVGVGCDNFAFFEELFMWGGHVYNILSYKKEKDHIFLSNEVIMFSPFLRREFYEVEEDRSCLPPTEAAYWLF